MALGWSTSLARGQAKEMSSHVIDPYSTNEGRTPLVGEVPSTNYWLWDVGLPEIFSTIMDDKMVRQLLWKWERLHYDPWQNFPYISRVVLEEQATSRDVDIATDTTEEQAPSRDVDIAADKTDRNSGWSNEPAGREEKDMPAGSRHIDEGHRQRTHLLEGDSMSDDVSSSRSSCLDDDKENEIPSSAIGIPRLRHDGRTDDMYSEQAPHLARETGNDIPPDVSELPQRQLDSVTDDGCSGRSPYPHDGKENEVLSNVVETSELQRDTTTDDMCSKWSSNLAHGKANEKPSEDLDTTVNVDFGRGPYLDEGIADMYSDDVDTTDNVDSGRSSYVAEDSEDETPLGGIDMYLANRRSTRLDSQQPIVEAQCNFEGFVERWLRTVHEPLLENSETVPTFELASGQIFGQSPWVGKRNSQGTSTARGYMSKRSRRRAHRANLKRKRKHAPAPAPAPNHIRNPVHAVMATPELLELIFLQMTLQSIFSLMRVCRWFRDVIAASPSLQKRLWLRCAEPDNQIWSLAYMPALRSLPDHSNYWQNNRGYWLSSIGTYTSVPLGTELSNEFKPWRHQGDVPRQSPVGSWPCERINVKPARLHPLLYIRDHERRRISISAGYPFEVHYDPAPTPKPKYHDYAPVALQFLIQTLLTADLACFLTDPPCLRATLVCRFFQCRHQHGHSPQAMRTKISPVLGSSKAWRHSALPLSRRCLLSTASYCDPLVFGRNHNAVQMDSDLIGPFDLRGGQISASTLVEQCLHLQMPYDRL